MYIIIPYYIIVKRTLQYLGYCHVPRWQAVDYVAVIIYQHTYPVAQPPCPYGGVYVGWGDAGINRQVGANHVYQRPHGGIVDIVGFVNIM
jgi:hypothetical protein